MASNIRSIKTGYNFNYNTWSLTGSSGNYYTSFIVPVSNSISYALGFFYPNDRYQSPFCIEYKEGKLYQGYKSTSEITTVTISGSTIDTGGARFYKPGYFTNCVVVY